MEHCRAQRNASRRSQARRFPTPQTESRRGARDWAAVRRNQHADIGDSRAFWYRRFFAVPRRAAARSSAAGTDCFLNTAEFSAVAVSSRAPPSLDRQRSTTSRPPAPLPTTDPRAPPPPPPPCRTHPPPPPPPTRP